MMFVPVLQQVNKAVNPGQMDDIIIQTSDEALNFVDDGFKNTVDDVLDDGVKKTVDNIVDDTASQVSSEASVLEDVSDNIFKSGQKALDNFDIGSAYVKPKHLSTSSGNGAKFLGDSKDAAEQILQNAMKNGTVKSIKDNGLTKFGQQSYEIIIDAGQKVGTKGEQLIKIVISDDGGMLSAYPVK